MSQKVTGLESKYVNPDESRKYMRQIWKAENELLQQIISVLSDIKLEHPTDDFYYEVLPVPPPNVRPVSKKLISNK